jgi:outer membrane autotransporter protein
VLTASGNLIGTFSPIGDISAFLSLTASYDAHNAYLDVAQSRSLTQASRTGPQIAVAGYIQSLPTSNALFVAAVNLPTDASARSAFDQLSGSFHGSLTGVLLEDSRFARSAVLDRLADTTCDAAPLSNGAGNPKSRIGAACVFAPGRFATWGTTFGSWGRNRDGSPVSLDRAIGGFLTGVDTVIADVWRFGITTGYSQSRLSAGSTSGSGDNYSLGLYGGTQRGDIALRLGGVYTWHDIATNRFIGFSGFSDRVKADYNAATAQIFGELGYRLPVRNAVLEPFVNVAYVNVHTNGFTETGGLVALDGRAGNNGVTFTTLGLHVSTDFTVGGIPIFAKETVGWRHALGDVNPKSVLSFVGDSNAFHVSGVRLGSGAATLTASLGLKLGPNAALSASYHGQFSTSGTDQGAKANLNIAF